MKKTLFLDMDGVIADFDLGIKCLVPGLDTGGETQADYEIRSKLVDEICEANPTIFHDLPPIPGAIETVNKLFELFDVYFLSTPMWNVPDSYTGKRIWLEKHFGDKVIKKLILTHRKDFICGDILVDDRHKNGAGEFNGEFIHFGSALFPNWESVFNYLVQIQ
jgi:5'-nucleotidase